MALTTDRGAALLVLLFPLLLLSVRSGTNGCFLLLVLLSFYEMARRGRVFFNASWDATALVYGAAMASFAVATLISQTANFQFNAGPYDGASRFLFAVPVYLMLRQMPERSSTIVQYGFVGGCFSALLVSLLFPPPTHDRLGTFYLNVIHFGDLVLMLGVMSALSIRWYRGEPVAMVILKLCASAAALWMTIESGTRGAWLALPVIVAVWAVLSGARVSLRGRVAAASVLILAIVLTYLFVPWVSHRVDLVTGDLSRFTEMRDSATGMRLQIWVAALHLFAQHPLFGVGPDQFGAHVQELAAAGYLTPTAAELARAEVHNEILTRAVTLGIVGLASILAIYAVPFVLFVQAVHARNSVARTAGVLGACFVAGFFVFGLTAEIFDLKATATFYSLTVAVLLAIATHKGPNPTAA